MKKFLLSIFVILTFIVYAINQRTKSTNQPSVTVVPTSSAAQSSSANLNTQGSNGSYKDGQYTGDSVDAYYGNVQVKVTIAGGQITDVQFLDYPHDRPTSSAISSQAMPILKSEAIQAQSAQVDIVSGATAISQGFQQSLQSALVQAKV